MELLRPWLHFAVQLPRQTRLHTKHFSLIMSSRTQPQAVPSKGYDADAPYLIESYQNTTTPLTVSEHLPSYSYSNDPHTPNQPRSWDEAARVKSKPLNPNPYSNGSHIYVNVDQDGQDMGDASTSAPAPLNSAITGYATGLGWDLGKMCAMAYVLPPFSSVPLLIWETQNVRLLFCLLTQDLVRFHAYQAGMGGAGVLIFTFLLRLIFGWHTLAILLRYWALFGSWYFWFVSFLLSYRSYLAHQSATSLERDPFLPVLGSYAVTCVGEE